MIVIGQVVQVDERPAQGEYRAADVVKINDTSVFEYVDVRTQPGQLRDKLNQQVALVVKLAAYGNERGGARMAATFVRQLGAAELRELLPQRSPNGAAAAAGAAG